MLRAVFVRTLKAGVTYEQFRDAWRPAEAGHPARTSVGRNVTNERQVITILELDLPLTEFEAIAGSLTRPDARDRLEEIVESTELAGVYEEVLSPDAFP